MKKLAVILSFLFLFGSNAEAKNIDLSQFVEHSALSKTATIAVSVKNAKTGATEYEYNEQKLLHPASVLKIVTLPAALSVLGKDFEYETKFGLDEKKNLYIKLSGDPRLSGEQLKSAIEAISVDGLEGIIIDDKALDRYEWGVGWMWDDETNPLMAKVSPYNFKGNLLTVKVAPSDRGGQPLVYTESIGATAIVNMVKQGSKNDILIHRQNAVSPNVIYVYGTVNSLCRIPVPVANPERNFITNLLYHLKSKNITHPNNVVGVYPNELESFYTVKNPIEPIIPRILQDSSNFYAETLFKTAGGLNAKSQGTFENSQKLFNEYYKKLGLDTKKVVFADASGVSRNNLFSAEWITDALYAIQKDENFDYIKSNMATPTVGTLKNRLPELKNRLYAKTGTLSNINTVTGYVTDSNGDEHIFTILIQNFTENMEDIREFQDRVIRVIAK